MTKKVFEKCRNVFNSSSSIIIDFIELYETERIHDKDWTIKYDEIFNIRFHEDYISFDNTLECNNTCLVSHKKLKFNKIKQISMFDLVKLNITHRRCKKIL